MCRVVTFAKITNYKLVYICNMKLKHVTDPLSLYIYVFNLFFRVYGGWPVSPPGTIYVRQRETMHLYRARKLHAHAL